MLYIIYSIYTRAGTNSILLTWHTHWCFRMSTEILIFRTNLETKIFTDFTTVQNISSRGQ